MIMFNLFMLCIVFLLIYVVILSVIRLFTGGTLKDAKARLYNFFNESSQARIENNTIIFHNFEVILSKIIGESRFKEYIRLKERCFDTLPFGVYLNNAVPFFYFSCIYNDDTEKDLIDLNAKKLITRYLKLYGLPEICHVDWNTHSEMHSPLLIIYFSRNEREKKALKTMISETNIILNAEKPKDEDDEDDRNY